MPVPLTDEQLAYDKVPIPFTPVTRLERGKLYVRKRTLPHQIYGYAQSYDVYSVVDLAGYKKGYEPRTEILGVYTPSPQDTFRLQNGHLPPYQPTATGDKLQEAMAKLPTFEAWRVAPELHTQTKQTRTAYYAQAWVGKTLEDSTPEYEVTRPTLEEARQDVERWKQKPDVLAIELYKGKQEFIEDIEAGRAGGYWQLAEYEEWEPVEYWQRPDLLPQTVTGTCYQDAWRFLIREKEGELIHGTVFSGGRRMGHAWVETATGWVWEPETGKFFTPLGFKSALAPVIEAKYNTEQAAIMVARTRHFGPWTEEERKYIQHISPQTQTTTAADYWNARLEHNALRSPEHGKGPDTDAGAFLAWQLEAAGDIIRELSKAPYADSNYIFEKFNRLKNNLKSRDWTDPLSARENEALVKIKADIEGLPADTELLRTVKTVLIAIANRKPQDIEAQLGTLRNQLQVIKYSPKVVSQYPSGSLTVTVGDAVVQGRFERKGEMFPGQTEPNIIATVVKPGTKEDELAALKEVEDTLRAEVREVEDAEELQRVEPIVRVKPPPEREKYPLVVTLDEYKKDWEPKGWKIIFIGPTSTWRQEWGVWEAIRDLVQNALDETESYQWGYDDDGLWLADKGKGVAVADFLLGPPKLKADYARGKFGEGMKIASLALLRNGYNVRIETVGRELWMVFIEQEADGKVQSLSALWKPDGTTRGTEFHIIGYFGSAYEDRFVVNLPKSAIIAKAPAPVTEPFQRYNQLINYEFEDGPRIFARDIYMRPISSLFSYNLWGFEMSPDRFGPKNEDDVWNDIGRLWCCVKDIKLLEVFLQMMRDPPIVETDESHRINMGDYATGLNPATGASYKYEIPRNDYEWKEAWKNVFGEQFVIRTNSEWDGIVKHLGYESVSLMWGVTSAIALVIPTDRVIIDQSQQRLREVQVIPDSRLTGGQLAHLELARAIGQQEQRGTPLGGVHAAVIPPASERVRTAGMYGRSTREIFIHIDQLIRGRSTVDTVIHELAHHTSGAEDAEEAHNREMTRIAGDVVRLTSEHIFDDYIKAPGFSW